MAYIVLDLEWNQAMSTQASVFYKLPFRLRGEIIQIGAVKLQEDMTPGEEFHIDVRPVYFRKIHYRVKKLTGFDKERLRNGVGFPEAMAEFRAWCGENVVFLTWGIDDKGIMEQNIMIHDLDWDWIDGWINLQNVYNRQIGGDRNQKSLASAMEYFSIPQTRVAHDALGDAYNTAVVCSKLHIQNWREDYVKTGAPMQPCLPLRNGGEDAPKALEHSAFHDYASKIAAFSAPEISCMSCPVCGNAMKNTRWVDQGDRRYMTLFDCREHGKYLVRLKFRKDERNFWSVNRIVYKADETQQKFYEAKLQAPKRHVYSHGRRGRSRRGKKSEN